MVENVAHLSFLFSNEDPQDLLPLIYLRDGRCSMKTGRNWIPDKGGSVAASVAKKTWNARGRSMIFLLPACFSWA
ncbi:hypothetical protein CEXT_640001 [Caerostris extrusa]|uniref:Uncharacterized protein n=1 Tax=Caerostris extrusa TaxID=172846 RepID=A0AAV4NSZ3_CAEEX|nr:hypothetical protein CEXT_640001 [Caerostris extrusa]